MIRRGFYTLGETGELSAPANPANEGEPVRVACNPEEHYAGADTPILDTAQALDIISKLSSGVAQLADTMFKAELQKKLGDAYNKAKDAQGRGMQAGNAMNEIQNQMNDVRNTINSLNTQRNGLLSTLNSLEGNISSIQLQINSTQQSISTLNSNVSALTVQLKSLQSSSARAKYPPGLAGTQQWRADQLALNDQIKATQLKVLDYSKQKDALGANMNAVGAQKAALTPQIKEVDDRIGEQYKIDTQLQSQRREQAKAYAEARRDGQKSLQDAQDAVVDYQDKSKDILVPLSECSGGAKTLAKALVKFEKDKWASGAGDLLRGGFESGMRNFASPALGWASFFGADGITAISDGLQNTIDSSNSQNLEQNIQSFIKNVAISAGDEFVGLNYWMALDSSLELSYAILNNPNNPNAGTDAMNEWAINGVPNAVQAVGKPVEKASYFFVGPAGPPVAEKVTSTLALASSGLLQTAINAELAPLSAPLTPGEYNPRPMGKGLFYPPEGFGSRGSLGTVVGVGMGATLIEVGKGIMSDGAKQNPKSVAQINKALTDLTRVYSVQNKLKGSVEIRPTDIPTGIPVKIGGD